jgi:apolipoprotein N-acyltransferase
VLRFLGGIQSGVVVDSGIFTHSNLPAPVIRASVIDFASHAVYQSDKQYLVPQGEYMPHLYNLLFRQIGLGPALDILYPIMSFQPGPLVSQQDWSSNIPGVLFCFESIDPLAVRRLMSERTPPFIAHILSHAWFHNPILFWQQTDQMLRVQAVWNQITIVSAGNYGPSKAYLPNGQIIIPTALETGEHWSVGVVEIPIRGER